MCGNFQYFPGNLFSLFTGIVYYVLDKVHFQNIMLTMLIITKKQGLEKIIFKKSIVALQNGMLMVHIEMKKEKF